MATEFIATIKASGGDFTTCAAWEAALQNDLTAASIKVFSISGCSATAPPTGEDVHGGTSGATATVVLVNAAKTQILLKTISGTFQSGENVHHVTDVNSYVVLSNAGAAPIAVCSVEHSGEETDGLYIVGWTTDVNCYVKIIVQSEYRHSGKRSPEKHRLKVANWGMYSDHRYTRVIGMQITVTVADPFLFEADVHGCVFDSCLGINEWTSASGFKSCFLTAYPSANGYTCYIVNCIGIVKFATSNTESAAFYQYGGTGYNHTVRMSHCSGNGACRNAFHAYNDGWMYLTNCYGGGTSSSVFLQTFGNQYRYNCLSSDTTAGTSEGCHNSIAFNTTNFTNVTAGSEDYTLPAGSALIGEGRDVSGEAFPLNCPIDIIGTARPQGASWDVGAFEYVAPTAMPWIPAVTQGGPI